MQAIKEHLAPSISGFLAIFIYAIIGAALWSFKLPNAYFGIYFGVCIASVTGFLVVHPNQATVIMFLGNYLGTVRRTGFIFTIPFTIKAIIPLRLDNFSTDLLKVNDFNGNPIEIAAVIVWRVTDAAQSVFNVEDYRKFVEIQSDSAVRSIAARYPYDTDDGVSLRANIEQIGQELMEILQSNLAVAGIVVEETRLTHLAYSAEVAVAMLKRQQAVAIFQARQYLVKNALDMIDDVLKHFDKGEVKISNDKKAELINSLLITMVSDKESSPVLNLNGKT